MENTYWSGKGTHQTAYTTLWDKLVPACGEAKTPHGELLRAIGRLMYDYYNNGFCNLDSQHLRECITTIEENEKKILEHMDRGTFCKVLSDLHNMANNNMEDFYPFQDNSDYDYEGEFPVRFEKLADAIVLVVSEIDGDNDLVGA